MSEAAHPRIANETGAPGPFLYMHSAMTRNYANWDWRDELTDLAFAKRHLDDWTGARHTMNSSAHIRF